jgi:hypothetical protein
MGAIKRELERLAEIVIYGNPETIQREFEKAQGLSDNGAIGLVSYAIEFARDIAPLCECGEDYAAELHARFPQFVEQINKAPAKIERVLSNAEDGW